MHRFSTVRVDVDREGDAAVIPVRVAVAEANHGELLAGGGFGVDPLDYAARLRVQLTQVGWPTPLSTVGVELKPAVTLLRTGCTWYEPWDCQAEPLARLIGTLTQQDLVRTGLVGQVEGGLDYVTIEAYRSKGLHVRLGASSPVGTPRLQLQASWLLGVYAFNHFSPALDDATIARLHLDRDERLGTFPESLVLDLRDDPVEPHLGAFAALRVTEGTAYAGGAFDFVELEPELRGFLPLGPLVLAARVRLGAFSGDVPPTERFYAGGASSHRGFPERELSQVASNPEDGSTVVIGGAGLLETAAEQRVQLARP
jgi:outer membrane protein assembly factor BamA